MNRTVVALLVLSALAAGCSRRSEPAGGAPRAVDAAPAAVDAPGLPAPAGSPDEMVVDPFCGVRLRRRDAAASAVWNGVTYWFCLADHRDAFLADPVRALCRLAGADAGMDCGR